MTRRSRTQRPSRRNLRNQPLSLRTPSDATPALRASFAQKRTEIEIAAGIAAASVGSEISRLKPDSSIPRGMRGWLSAAEWTERWEACINHLERLEVLGRMNEQLGIQAIDRSQVRGTEQWKIRVATDTRASAVVAAEEGVTASRIRQLRMDYVAGRLKEKR